MDATSIIGPLAASATTSAGFFWKAGWAFVLGYAISAMIQVFVPRARLVRLMGSPSARSVALASGFGAISSSCSFAALATARSLVKKGAHFVAAVAFMFASTNLVIELGILILIFLGWQYLAAEVVGGVMLIAISTILIRLTYPRAWMDAARERVEAEGEPEEDDFDWRARIRSREGWRMVGRRFGMEWGMVWREILIGFTVAGLVATLVPDRAWEALFLAGPGSEAGGGFLVVLENAAVAPFVAAATFIGSMGNIPLATVLASKGVLFAGIMGFIYSDLMVPPLVKINAKYYGSRVSLYVAGVMYVSIVLTAITLHYLALAAGVLPESMRGVGEVTRFKVDYTLVLNATAVGAVGLMAWLALAGRERTGGERGGRSVGVQDVVAMACVVLLAGGLIAGAFV